jgi:hypothetical protein
MKKILIILLLLSNQVYAFQWSNFGIFTSTSLKKVVGALSEKEIDEIVEYINRCSGKCEYGKIFGKRQLSNEALEDAFIRIAIKHGKIYPNLAEEFSKNLSGVPGYKSALSKIIGNSESKSAGHLFELNVANTRKKMGAEITSISHPFNDGIKSHITDIDLIFKQDEISYAAEVKKYTSNISLDVVNRDVDTLLKFVEENPGHIPQFVFYEKPRDSVLKILESKGIQVIIEG